MPKPPLPKPDFRFNPPSEETRRAAASTAISAYGRGEALPDRSEPDRAASPESDRPSVGLPGQTWRMVFERAGVVVTPVEPADQQFIDMVMEFERGHSTPLLSEIVPFVQAIAASRIKSKD